MKQEQTIRVPTDIKTGETRQVSKYSAMSEEEIVEKISQMAKDLADNAKKAFPKSVGNVDDEIEMTDLITELQSRAFTKYMTLKEKVGKCRKELLWFATEMEERYKKSDYRGVWRVCSLDFLREKLEDKIDKVYHALLGAVAFQDEDVIKECADAANFLMMIADVIRRRKENESS